MQQFTPKDFCLSIENCGCYYNPNPPFTRETRIVPQYEIDYFDHGKGFLEINGTPICFEENTINLRTPGQTVRDPKPQHCICIWFDIIPFDKLNKDTIPKKLQIYQKPQYQNCFLNHLPSKISLEGQEEITVCIKKILEYYGYADENFSALMIKSYLNLLLAHLYEIYLGHHQNLKKYNFYVNKAIRFIRIYYTQERLKCKDIADHVGLSLNYFQKTFKDCTGVTPNNYLLQVRIKRAKQYLEKSSCPISDIADACGFSSNTYFSYVFKQLTGISPSQYRAEFSNSVDFKNE